MKKLNGLRILARKRKLDSRKAYFKTNELLTMVNIKLILGNSPNKFITINGCLQFYYKNEDDQFDQNESLLTSLHEYSKYKVS